MTEEVTAADVIPLLRAPVDDRVNSLLRRLARRNVSARRQREVKEAKGPGEPITVIKAATKARTGNTARGTQAAVRQLNSQPHFVTNVRK